MKLLETSNGYELHDTTRADKSIIGKLGEWTRHKKNGYRYKNHKFITIEDTEFFRSLSNDDQKTAWEKEKVDMQNTISDLQSKIESLEKSLMEANSIKKKISYKKPNPLKAIEQAKEKSKSSVLVALKYAGISRSHVFYSDTVITAFTHISDANIPVDLSEGVYSSFDPVIKQDLEHIRLDLDIPKRGKKWNITKEEVELYLDIISEKNFSPLFTGLSIDKYILGTDSFIVAYKENKEGLPACCIPYKALKVMKYMSLKDLRIKVIQNESNGPDIIWIWDDKVTIKCMNIKGEQPRLDPIIRQTEGGLRSYKQLDLTDTIKYMKKSKINLTNKLPKDMQPTVGMNINVMKTLDGTHSEMVIKEHGSFILTNVAGNNVIYRGLQKD